MSLATSTAGRRLTLRTTPAARKARRVEHAAWPATVTEFVGLALDVIDSWHETEDERRAAYPARLDAYDRLRDLWASATEGQKAGVMGYVTRIMGRDWTIPDPDLCGPGVDPRWYRMMTFAYRCRQGTTIRPWCHSGESLVTAAIEHARGFAARVEAREAAGRFYDYLTRQHRARVNRYLTRAVGLDSPRGLGYSARDRFAGHVACCAHGFPLGLAARY